jgi:hypothetical protein
MQKKRREGLQMQRYRKHVERVFVAELAAFVGFVDVVVVAKKKGIETVSYSVTPELWRLIGNDHTPYDHAVVEVRVPRRLALWTRLTQQPLQQQQAKKAEHPS